MIILPGIALAALLDADSRWVRAIVLGAAGSLSAAIVCGYYLLLARVPFVWFVASEYVALGAVLLWWRPGGWRWTARPTTLSTRRGTTWLLPALGLVFLSRSIPLFFNEVPLGLDPCFHTLIAKKILLSRVLPTDWTPFESVRLNYPVGSHILIAEAARLTGIPVHVVFKALFPVLASLTALSIYSVALRFFESRRIAWWSMVAYAFLAVWGSLDYYRWGGLPNLLGMLLMLCLVETAFTPWRGCAVLFAMIAAALMITHHHSALGAASVFLAYVLFVRLLNGAMTATSKRILVGCGYAFVACLAPLAAYVRAGGEVGRTSVLAFYEPPITLWEGSAYLGIPFAVLGVAGMVLIVRERRTEPALFLLFWVTVLFSLFAFFEYAYRLGVYVLQREFYTAFTPSRFLTNLAYPLSLAAGLVLLRIVERLRWVAAPALVGGGALVWSLLTIRGQVSRTQVDVAAFTWVAEHAEENAFVVSSSPWAPYFAWREGPFTPLPASEARNDRGVQYKRKFLFNDLGAIGQFAHTTRRAVYIAVPASSLSVDGFREVFRGAATRIYKLP